MTATAWFSRSDAGSEALLGMVLNDVLEPGRLGTLRRLALPDKATARLVLPADPHAAAAAWTAARARQSWKGRFAAACIRVPLRLGISRMAPKAMCLGDVTTRSGIERALDDVFGVHIEVATFLGPPRANRKPVLHVFHADGSRELVGIAKVGASPLAADLVRREARTLRRLASFRLNSFEIPRLVSEFDYEDMPVVAQSAVKASGPTPDRSSLYRVVDEIAGFAGRSHVTFETSSYLSRLRRQIQELPSGSVHTLCSQIVSAVVDSLSGETITFGSWHGDLTQWNMAEAGSRAVVWDWERYEENVPFGFDAFHHEFLPSFKQLGDTRVHSAGLALLEHATAILEPLGVTRHVLQIGLLYLVEIAVRFTADAQDTTGTRGGAVEKWLSPVAEFYKQK